MSIDLTFLRHRIPGVMGESGVHHSAVAVTLLEDTCGGKLRKPAPEDRDLSLPAPDRSAADPARFSLLFEVRSEKIGHQPGDVCCPGGMLEEGATSSWEEYIPEKHGIEHYEMYGDKFGCSLCHAWGAGPILLLGRYIAGVRPTSVGGKTWEVVPAPGRYQHFKAVVPIAGGSVTVEYRDGKVRAQSDIPGGVLKYNGVETEI